jgi:hypothetical protein
LEALRKRLALYLHSMESQKKMDAKVVIRVKGKVLNSFLGYIKSDLARLSIEAFP